jgi:hypothetical protein
VFFFKVQEESPIGTLLFPKITNWFSWNLSNRIVKWNKNIRMEKIQIDNCKACEPINSIIEQIINSGYKILESNLEDYHFHQMYFKVNADLHDLSEFDNSKFSLENNFLICNCHWSRIEFQNRL